MIVRITKGSHFGAATNYLFGKGNEPQEKDLSATEKEKFADGFIEGKRARILSTNMSGTNSKELADEFLELEKLKTGKKLKAPMRHFSISLKDGESLTTDKWQEVAESFLERTGYKDSPFLVIQHRDRNHEHIHIVTSRVTYSGKTVSDSFEKDKARTWAREIEEKYNLTRTPQRAKKKTLTRAETEQANRTNESAIREQIQTAVEKLSVEKRPATEFVNELRQQNIFFKPNIQKSGKVVGVSFAKANEEGKVIAFKGSNLGNNFKWSELAKKIEYAPESDARVFFDAKTEAQRAERGEIKTPALPTVEKPTLPAVENLTSENKIQSAKQKPIATGNEPKNYQEILIKEILQLSRESLAKQSIEPTIKAWKLFEYDFVNNAANEKSNETHREELEFLQKDAPKSERFSADGKTRLEAVHAMLKLATGNERDEIVRDVLANYEKKVVSERGEIGEPEMEKLAKTMSLERAAGAEVKPSLKIRNFKEIKRETLIKELITAAGDVAREQTGENLSYRQEKRLLKMYREVGNKKPISKQLDDLNALQNRFAEPMPQPKNFLEATILKLDNISDAERSAALRGQISTLNEVIEREDLQKAEAEKTLSQASKSDEFGRRDDYFIYELYRTKTDPNTKSYFELTNEAQERGFLKPIEYWKPENIQEQQIQQALYQMGVANALQEQMKKSLDEQGIKLEPLAQRIVNNTIDSWGKMPPTGDEYKSVQDINQSRGSGIIPENRLEAKAYIYTQSEERKRDQASLSLAKAANLKAEEIKQEQKQKQEKTIEMEKNYEDFSQGRSM